MRHRGLQSVKNSYGTSEAMLSHVETRETNGFSSPKSKPHFSPRIRGENQNLRGYIRDNGLKSMCWALALSEEAQWSEDKSIVRKTQDFELHELAMTEKAGRGRLRRVSTQLNEERVRKCVQLSRVTFQEVLLIRTCIVDVQDRWELRNIYRKATTTAINVLQLTSWSH